MCPSLDAFNALGNLVGSAPLMINEAIITLENVMERLDAIEKKMLTEEHIENLDRKMQSYANKIGSKVGEVFKLIKGKGTIIHERIEESPSRIDKLEEFFSNQGTAFASAKTPVKISKTTQVTKNKGATSSNDKGDLKMISIHPNFIEVMRDPFCKIMFFNLVPRSIVVENLYAKSLKNSKCLIEELENKDDKTYILRIIPSLGAQKR